MGAFAHETGLKFRSLFSTKPKLDLAVLSQAKQNTAAEHKHRGDEDRRIPGRRRGRGLEGAPEIVQLARNLRGLERPPVELNKPAPSAP